ncbi:MAG: hypothetical protein WC451_03725 [Patescibacteria group bacterium]
MKTFFHKLIYTLIITSLLAQPFLVFVSKTRAEEDFIEHGEGGIFNDEIEVTGGVVVSDPIAATASALAAIEADSSITLETGATDWSLSKLGDMSSYKSKLVFNPSDLQDIRILSCLGNAIPDYANHDDSLAVTTGKSIEEIANLRVDRPDEWKKLVESAQETARQQLVSNLKYDLPNFACIAGVDEAMAAEMLAHDTESVNAIITYAQEKVIIDRRVLMLLVNLVTPKNSGGAGHDRIKIYRIRSGYDRDARIYSRESDVTREQITEQEEANTETTTVSDLSSASRDELSTNPEFDSAEAQAAVIDSAGTNQGDLIFSDTEDDQNMSAHSRGEAVDISEIDNIRCTLIKKKRIGGDSKTVQPATPIKVAWQTSQGYDASPPPDYSTLSMNLQQMASGQYLELLDQIGIDPDSEESMADATFGDIVSLIGESLLAEIINSPTNSLSGYSLSDTARKIGGMILADKLELPRKAFIEADLLDLRDLETKIGEAMLEEKLSLNYGSLRGENLGQILENVGLRHLEKQLAVPEGTITAGLSGPDLKIAVGRGIIEETLQLPTGTFKGDTSYERLKDIVGERKIEFLFANPSEIDELLGINFGYSLEYKNGTRSADAYSTIVGAKILSDHAYIFDHNSASANALRLDVDPSAATAGSSLGAITSSNQDTVDVAKARFNWIMSGAITNVPGVATPGSFSEIYKAIGIDALSAAMTSNSQTRTAISRWLEVNSQPDRTNCSVVNPIVVPIPNPNTDPGQPATIDVTIPEDQIMATFGLRRGDLSRLFGCYNVAPAAVYKGLGEKALYNAVLNSTVAEQARTKYLADHPEITNFLNDVEFYRSRITTIVTLVNKIKEDWRDQSSENPSTQQAISQINSTTSSIGSVVGNINVGDISLSNLGDAVRTVREIPVQVDQVMSAVTTIQTANQELVDRANTTLADVSTIIHNIDEILAGEDQPEIGSLQTSNINVTNSESGGVVNRAMLLLLLSGRLSPKDFLTAVGASTVEESLNLPTNSILYYAKYLENPNRDKNDGKNAFFRAIGQAQLEETFGMPPYFFQGEFPASNATLTDVKNHVASTFNITQAEAGARIMQALELPGEFSTVENREIANISTLVVAANSVDEKLTIKQGTTANFLNGGQVDQANLGNSEIRMLAGKFDVSEEVINTFIRVRNGTESLEEAKKDKFKVSYNSHNEFAQKQSANGSDGNSLSDRCPIQFSYTSGTFSASLIEDNSYVYTNADGTQSFPSLEEARNYQEKTENQNKKVDFVQALGASMAPDAGSAGQVTNQLNAFLGDQNQASAFSDSALDGYRDQYHIPLELLQDFYQREDLIGDAADSKQIGSYIETIGKKTAERRITSTLLGGLTMTFAGLQIDASDIFDILDGNGLQVAYRIGARFLEDSLDIDPNLIIKVLEAPTQVLKNCSLSTIGGGLLGSALGVGTVSLSGNIYENVGAAKIEQVLGIPATSFRGATVDELISNVGAAKFAAAFGIPSSVAATADVVTGLFGNAESGYLRMPMEDQMSEIDRVLAYPNYVPGSVSDLTATSNTIETNVRNFIHRSDIWNLVEDPTAGTYEYQLYHFQTKIREIDSLLNLSEGKTKQMLTGTGGYTPDQYKRDIAGQVLLVNTTDILNALGLGEFSNFVVKGVALTQMITATVNDLKTCQNAGAQACTDAKVRIFDNLQTLLGVNFDAKLGLPSGTLATIITDPQRAVYTLISGALTSLDNSLGLVGDDGKPLPNSSFTSAFSIWWHEERGRPSYQNCDSDPQNCLSNDMNDNLVVGGFIPTSHNRWNYIAENIAGRLTYNWLTKLGILPTISPTGGSFAGYPNTETLIRESAHMLIHGDLRILEIAATVRGLEALHIYNDSNNPNLPDYLRISYEDVYYAIMGNPVMEQQYVDAATNNFAYSYSQGNTPSSSEIFNDTAEMENGGGAIYGSQCWPNASSESCVNATLINYAYSYYNNSQSFLQQPNNQSTGTPPGETIQQILMSPNSTQALRDTQEHARSQARSDNRNNLMWRMADAQLYQLDTNIPVGFTRTMFSGTGKQRTMMLLLYAANAINLSEIKIGGVGVGDIVAMIPVFKDTIDFFQNPNSFDLDSFIRNGRMETLDTWLSSKFSGFLGFDLAPGTFTSLFYGLKTGNFTRDNTITVGSEQRVIQGITNVYKDWATAKITSWADKALGLPQGTVFTAYKMYRDLNTARTALAKAKDAAAVAEAKANYAQIKAELISFIITTVFSKQTAQVEEALNLVPGTGAMLVSSAVSYLTTGAIPWMALAMFVIVNLFGVYKVEVICTADGYYPAIGIPSSTNPAGSDDPTIYDNGNLGTFDGMNNNDRKDGYIEAARYKVRTVIGDALMLAEKSGDETAVPSQIMTGRQEDVDYWNYKIDEEICDLIGGCEGTRAGAWLNQQTTSYIHIGF